MVTSETNSVLHHTHICVHCDTTWSDTCLETGYDFSKLHECWQRKWYARKLAIALGDNTQETSYPTPNPLNLMELNEDWETFRERVERAMAKRIEGAVNNSIIYVNKQGLHSEDCICKKCRRAFSLECNQPMREWND